jgi:hypothetical protein
MKLLRMLRLIFSPMREIARELKIIRELYEAELAERTPRIVRITEAPNPRLDTEVMIPGDLERPEWRRWLEPDRREPEEDDDE